jgi:cellulose synthase/poly-beta-1,6-N-acetylglucosamine synthase-like glycosyltransferase
MDGQGFPASALAGRYMRAVERLAPHRLAPQWADRAANNLFRTNPLLSAKAQIPPDQKIAVLGLALLLAMCVLWSASTIWIAVQISAATFFFTLILFRLTAAILPQRWAAARPLADQDLPVVTILAPVYKEAAVLDQLIGALGNIDYPGQLLDIKIIMEADDRETVQAARQLVFDSRFEIVIVPDGQPRTKPRALNYALEFARGDIVTVYDAEAVPHPGQLRAAAEAFAAADDRLACLQAPLNWYNHTRNWLTRQFALEYAVQFHAILPLLARLRLPLPLGGTSNHFRRAALIDAGGWDAYNVTEDADLGFRLAALGYRSDVIAPQTMEEAPEQTQPWVCQRTRWLKGYLQTLAVLLRRPARLTPGMIFSLSMTISAAAVSAILHGPTVVFLILLATIGGVNTHLPVLGLLGMAYAASMLCGHVAIRRAELRSRWIDVMRMPLYWPLQTIAAILALVELHRRPYFWAKTEHGFTKAAETECPSLSPSFYSFPRSQALPGRPGRPARNPIRQKARA